MKPETIDMLSSLRLARSLQVWRTVSCSPDRNLHPPRAVVAAPPFLRRKFLAALTSGVFAAANVGMAASLESSKIIPDVVDRLRLQKVDMKVAFGPAAAKDGALITPAKAAHAPKVEIQGPPGSLFTLICSDPDPPDPANPVMKEWLHWLVTNIQDNNPSTGQELVPYMGPAPPVGTHRYVFMLFEQPNQERIKAQDPTHGKRAKFNTREFTRKHGLGDPVSVEYFNSHK